MSPKSNRRQQENHENENGSSEAGKTPSGSLVKISENMTELELPLKILNDRITCSLCNGYFVEATTVLDCLHTFCKSCLLKHFEEKENTCPRCKTLIHQSHPTHYVAFDRTIQDIVYKLVPGMQEEEIRRRDEFEANRPSDSEDLEDEADEIPKLVPTIPVENGMEIEHNSEDCCLKDPCNGHRREDEPILVVLANHPQLAPLKHSFVRLPGLLRHFIGIQFYSFI